MILILHNLFQKIQEGEEILFFVVVSITLYQNQTKIEQKENITDLSLLNIDKYLTCKDL